MDQKAKEKATRQRRLDKQAQSMTEAARAAGTGAEQAHGEKEVEKDIEKKEEKDAQQSGQRGGVPLSLYRLLAALKQLIMMKIDVTRDLTLDLIGTHCCIVGTIRLVLLAHLNYFYFSQPLNATN